MHEQQILPVPQRQPLHQAAFPKEFFFEGYPGSLSGLVRATFKDEHSNLISSIFSSGILIGDQAVLTCSHNLMMQYRGKVIVASEIIFDSYHHQLRGHKKVLIPTQFNYALQEKNNGSYPHYDFSLVSFKQKAVQQIPPIAPKLNTNAGGKSTVTIYGYASKSLPQERIHDKQLTLSDIYENKKIVGERRHASERFQYSFLTREKMGTSGSPVWAEDRLLGIHKAFDYANEVGVGIAIQDMMGQLRSWGKQHNLSFYFE